MRALGPGKLDRVQVGRDRFMWRLTYTDSTHRRVRKQLSSDRRTAEQLARELVRTRDLQLAGIGMLTAQDVRLGELLDKYLVDLGTRATAQYTDQLASRFRRAVRDLKVERVRDLRPYAVLEFRARLLAQGMSPSTANRFVTSLQVVLNWAVGVELIGENPLRRVRRIPLNEKNKTKKRRALSEVEIARLLDAARQDDVEQTERVAAKATIRARTQGRGYALRMRPTRVPQFPLWMAFLESGARYGELVACRWTDIDFETRMLRLRAETTKSAKERRIPVRNELLNELRTVRPFHERIHRRSLNPDDRLFLGPEGRPLRHDSGNVIRRLNRLLEIAGIDRTDSEGRSIDLHALRHTLASRLARNNIAQVQVAKILGHSDVRLTASVYQHLDTEDIRGAIESLAPAPPTPAAAPARLA